MIVGRIGQSSSPGNEQRILELSRCRSTHSRNLIGIQNPVVDALVDQIIAAPNHEALVKPPSPGPGAAMELLPVLNWYTNEHRIAYQARLRHPEFARYVPLDTSLDTWWDSTAMKLYIGKRLLLVIPTLFGILLLNLLLSRPRPVGPWKTPG